MATHSSVLAWRIPGTMEPGGLPCMALHSQTRLKRLSSRSSRRVRWGQGRAAQEGDDRCIIMADLCCCTAETNTTL